MIVLRYIEAISLAITATIASGTILYKYFPFTIKLNKFANKGKKFTNKKWKKALSNFSVPDYESIQIDLWQQNDLNFSLRLLVKDNEKYNLPSEGDERLMLPIHNVVSRIENVYLDKTLLKFLRQVFGNYSFSSKGERNYIIFTGSPQLSRLNNINFNRFRVKFSGFVVIKRRNSLVDSLSDMIISKIDNKK